MEYIKGINFYPFSRKGSFLEKEVFQSLKVMKNTTGANYVIFTPNGLQDTPQSEDICYENEANVTDDELCNMISYAKELGLKVILKPTVNCKNGTWRAHISFFDEDVICEPKWGNWFESYTNFQLHYAKLAQSMHCEMVIAGCEMVMSEHRETEWREVISAVRSEYKGLVSYNTDKYQEHNVSWWDCVDVISSSGYYPIDDLERQLDRIETVINQYKKPFFFAEMGCMSTEGSKYVPNNWTLTGPVDLQGQADWYEAMFQAMEQRNFINGCALWSWDGKLYSDSIAQKDGNYEIYKKPSLYIVSQFFSKH